jgi:hypothetical protein
MKLSSLSHVKAIKMQFKIWGKNNSMGIYPGASSKLTYPPMTGHFSKTTNGKHPTDLGVYLRQISKEQW